MPTVGILLICGKIPNGIRADISKPVGFSLAERRRACMNSLCLGSSAWKIGSASICAMVTMVRYLRKEKHPFKGFYAHYTPLLFGSPAFLYFCDIVRAILCKEDDGGTHLGRLCSLHPRLAEHDTLIALLKETGGRAIQHHLPLLSLEDVGTPQHGIRDVCYLHH